MSFQFQEFEPAHPGIKFFVCLLLGLLAIDAGATTGPIIRNNDEMGNFEIDWLDDCSDKCKLQESTDFGASWFVLATHRSGQTVLNYPMTNKPDGTYQYRVKDYEYDLEDQETIIEYSPVNELIVGPVYAPPTLEEQLAYEYEIRIGDIDSDGFLDLFLNRISPAPVNNGTIRSVILKYLGSGLFEPLVPSTPQINAASLWPITTLRTVQTDVNLDRFADIAVKGVDSYYPFINDLIVYSPAVAYANVPRGVRSIDQGFVDFANDMIKFYDDPNYFSDNAMQVQVPGEWEREYDCELEWRGWQGWEYICRDEWVWEEGGIVTVYPGMSDLATSTWETAVSANTGATPWQSVVNRFSQILAMNISVGPWCIVIFDDDDVEDCPSAALAAIIVAMSDVLEDEKSPNAREADVVYLTGHRTLFGGMHTAIEYALLGAEATTISAGPDDFLSIGLNTKLEAAPNRATDLANRTLGTIASSFVGEPAGTHFARLLIANQNYMTRNCLPYQGLPEQTPGVGYNSNSYTSGILGATGGISTVPLSSFFGGTTFVPHVWFSSNPPPCPN